MCDKPTRPSTTDDALKVFFPGQKISLKPLNGPQVSFTVCRLSMPVTKSIVVLVKPNTVENAEEVVIKIYDPRYLDQRIPKTPSLPSYPWNLVNEQAAAMARQENMNLSIAELEDILYSVEVEDLGGEALATHHSLKEELFYRLMTRCYHSEIAAYERLKDLQGSAIPRLPLAGHFLPPDKRAIQPPAVVLEYIPSVSLHHVFPTAITPAIYAQVVSVIESFPLHGVIHNDITLTNIHFTPPEQPARAVLIDFGCALIRREHHDEERWAFLGRSDVRWAKRLLEGKQDGTFGNDSTGVCEFSS